MAKKRGDRPALESVKLPADVMESARIVAAYTGEPMADMLGDMLRPILAKREQDEAAKRKRATRRAARPAADESAKGGEG